MPSRTPSTPKYRHHKPSGQAVVTLNGRDVYLGRYDTPASRAEYDRVVAEWLANGRRLATSGHLDLTVTELLVRYVEHCDGYYVKDGKPTSEPTNIRLALRPLRRLYGHSRAQEFGPLSLEVVQQDMADSGKLCRNDVNKRIRHIVRAFKWGVRKQLVPPTVHAALTAVTGLRKGRSSARESEPVRPVSEEHVDAIRDHVPPQVWAMVRLQLLTGARPGEICIIRGRDIDKAEPVWVYTPSSHKTEHHGHARKIFIGPKAQEVLKPWTRGEPGEFLFSPIEVMEARFAALRAARRTKVQPSQKARTRAETRERAPGEHYSTASYQRVIRCACKKAGVPRWRPHQLRHNAATYLRKEFGLDTARVVLGHRSAAITEVYAEVDMSKAIAAMEKVG